MIYVKDILNINLQEHNKNYIKLVYLLIFLNLMLIIINLYIIEHNIIL